MTAQKHIDKIGASLVEMESRARDVKQAARLLQRAMADHHALLDAAQADYQRANPSSGVVAFSGGHDKPPPPPDPDEPIPPPKV